MDERGGAVEVLAEKAGGVTEIVVWLNGSIVFRQVIFMASKKETDAWQPAKHPFLFQVSASLRGWYQPLPGFHDFFEQVDIREDNISVVRFQAFVVFF